MNAAFSALRRRWLALSLLFVTLIAHLIIYASQPDTGNSRTFKLMVAAIAGAALIVWGFTVLLTSTRLNLLRQRMRRLQGVFILFGVGIMFLFGIEMRPEWVYAHTALTLAITFSLAYMTVFEDPQLLIPTWLWRVTLLVVVVAICGIRVASLSVHPIMNTTDEPQVIAWSLGFMRTGEFGDPMMHGGGMDVHRVYALRALWFKLVGIGLWEGRLLSFFLVLILIGLTTLAARNFYDQKTAWFTAGFMFSSAVVVSAMRLRHDVDLAIAIAASLWVYSEAIKRQNPRLHLVAGLIMGLGWFAHYNATFFGMVMVLGLYGPSYLAQWRTGHRRPQRAVVYYVLGGLLGAACFVIFQIIPDWTQFEANRAVRHPQTLAKFIDLTFEHIRNISTFSHYELLLIGLGVGAALWRRQTSDSMLLIMLIGGHLALGIFTSVAFDYLIVPLTPIYGLLVGSLFSRGVGNKRLGTAASIVFLFFVAANLGLTLVEPIEHVRTGGPLRLPIAPPARWILNHIPSDATIAGEHYYYLWLTDYDFVSPFAASQLPLADREKYPTDQERWDFLDIDVFIIDRNMATFGHLQPILENDYLATRGYTLVAEFPGRNEPIQIYSRLTPP